MKILFRLLGKLIIHIGSFFDKWLITPITKLFLGIGHLLKRNTKGLDRFIGKKSTLIVISLILAVSAFWIIDRESNVLIDQYAEVLYKQPVHATYNEELYVVEGLPKTVDITLVGQKRHIFLAKQSPSTGVTVDLTGLKPGNHKVTLKYSQRIASLDYKLEPSEVTVTIYEKVSETRTLDVDILHKDNLDSKLYIADIDLDRTNVIIKGAKYKIKKVATVKALVDVDDFVNPTAGTMDFKDVPLVAYDSKGKKVNVEIVPKTVDAKVKITSPSKEIPIEIIPKGHLAFGKSISSLTADINTVKVYGEQAVIDKIEKLPVKINVKNLEEDKTFTVTLEKPAGITDISVTTIKVYVKVADSDTKDFKDIPIATENLNSRYKVQALSEADSKTTVVVKGSKDLLNDLDSTTIKAYVDLKNYGIGEHEVDVKVSGEDLRLTYTPKTKRIKVRITQK
ncbi:MAG: hypothetical protein IJH13_03630 [Bacilli bacterium]|nr:hypothetical protein [Bacilli bacterium]